VVIFTAVRTAYDHHDEVVIANINLFVSHRRFQQMPIFINPFLEVERFRNRHKILFS